MRAKLISLLFLTLFFWIKASGTTFVVTSNADSGPGTLRDALTQAAANGSATQDIIQFNFADLTPAGRTITLVSQLPDLSSNLVIDGSTQPGLPFGQSDAYVKISTPFNNIAFITFNGTGLNDVEFYGLYIYDYSDINTLAPDLKGRIGLNITNSSNIIFGAPGKGNLLRGFNVHAIYFDSISGVKIQSNVIGLNENNDLSEAGNISDTADITLLKCNSIEIGGQTNESNTMFCYTLIGFAKKSVNNKLNISSNNFGVFQNGKSASWYYQEANFINIFTIDLNYFGASDADMAQSATADITIKGNVAGNFGNVFVINTLNGAINFTNNYLGIARDGITDLNVNSHPNEGAPIRISSCLAQINVGSNNAADQNFLAYCMVGVVAEHSSNIFIRNNEYECITILAYGNDNTGGPLPAININEVDNLNSQTILKGTAQPSATVDIYSSESCTYGKCCIRKYIGSTTADNSGNWQHTVVNLTGLFYVSATVGNKTSEFTTVKVNSSNVNIQNIRCGNSATISGLQVPKGLTYYWVDANGNTVSTDINLTTTKPGKYKLVLGEGCITSDLFEIDDDRVQIYDYSLVTTDISCSLSNGAIKGLYVFDPLLKISETKWTNSSGKVVGGTTDISNLPAGSYTLAVTTSDGCLSTYGPVTLKNLPGLAIDQSQVVIKPTNCTTPVGSVSNIVVTGTGTIKYNWTNAQQQQIAGTKDLIDQPPGVYTVQISDDSQCDPVTLSFIIPNSSQVAIDVNNVKAIAATCGEANGSIIGLKVTGAAKYSWTNNSGQVVGNTVDLSNINGGDYQLTATDDCGNTLQSSVFHIDQGNKAVFPNYAVSITDVCSGSSYGSINVSTDAMVKSARWVDGQGNTVGNNIELANASPGTYQLYLTDQNGCEAFYNKYTINKIPALQLSIGQVNDDQCSTSVGSVTGVNATGGKPPYNYNWTDGSGKGIASSNDITGLPIGEYTVTVTDASGCNPVSAQYTIHNQQKDIPPPSVNNLQLCSPGNAFLMVNNPASGYSYRLYETENSNIATTGSVEGKLNFDVKANTTVYVSQLKGSCESARTAVKITVGISGLNIPNTITPNGDSVNDYWAIPGMENYPNALVQIFTRYGQQVFESRGYAHPFDGTSNGQPLPVGVYYYIINLNSNCNLLTGNLTILR